MSDRLRIVVGLLVVALGFFWNDIANIFSSTLEEKPIVAIEKPTDEILEKVSSLSSKVTDKSDKDKLGIFNHVFSGRVKGWNADAQQINDLYVAAAKKVFGSSLRGKYDGYGEGIQSLMSETLGTENHAATEEEKIEIAENFSGLAYSLVNCHQ